MGKEEMGQEKREARQERPLSEMDATKAIIQALNRIAAAIETHAKATDKLAEATAAGLGADEDEPEYGLNGRRLG